MLLFLRTREAEVRPQNVRGESADGSKNPHGSKAKIVSSRCSFPFNPIQHFKMFLSSHNKHAKSAKPTERGGILTFPMMLPTSCGTQGHSNISVRGGGRGVQAYLCSQRGGREAPTFPCMSSRRVRVTPKPPSPKSCSQFIAVWGWHAGKRMNGAHSLVAPWRGGQRWSAALRGSSALL